MVLNAAVQMLRGAEELKQKILKFSNGTSMLHDKSLWTTQQQLQKLYQKVLMIDLEYALEKKVEQDLWNVGFKQQIEALQSISKDRKNQLKNEAQAMLSWVLQAAAGFYLCLLHHICTSFKLDLPFRRRASLLGAVEGWDASPSVGAGVGTADAGAARYVCQHCLVHLGDLARYRQQLRVAHTFYRHALAVSVHSGHPYNQLALVSWRRGRRLAAVYWHVRSLLVRAPFPPAPANLARTLAAAASRDVKEAPTLPVLPGLTTTAPSAYTIPERLDSHTYVNELVRTVHYLHTVENLDVAAELVNTLSTSLSSLIATDSFDSMTLVKMAVVQMWLVHAATEGLSLETVALSATEARAVSLSHGLCAATALALLLPAYAGDPPRRAMPALKVWLQWVVFHPKVVSSSAWASKPHLWAALAYVINKLSPLAKEYDDKYDAVPLPEDEELNGFLPLEEHFKGLKFNNCSWESNGLPEADPNDDDSGSTNISSLSLIGEPELEHRVRVCRLLRLAQRLALQHPHHITCATNEDGTLTFEASEVNPEQLEQVLSHLNAARTPDLSEPLKDSTFIDPLTPNDTRTPEDSPSPLNPPPPVIISEADFREKVREKRVGILKPQGSLERAREERALATTLEEPEVEVAEESKSEDTKEVRKQRVNIAMAAILRKQEETNKQVKFVTPPPTPDRSSDVGESKEDKPIVIQPKVIKSLANLPIGRKTGGILSLKDKTAGYPHLQKTDLEPKKTEKEEKKESNPNQSVSPNSQSYQKRDQTNWTPQNYETPRTTFQKNYGIQNAGLSYNPNYQSNQGIKLPVVNPKEIDVRTAALQKQSSRQDLFQDGNKFSQNYQMSGDKKNFLADLPPRFANQYRYWQNAQDSRYNENKFRDDTMKNNVAFNQNPRQNWSQTDAQMQWWKPENQPNFSPQSFATPPVNMPNFYSTLPTNMPNPYASIPFNHTIPNLGQNVPTLTQNIPNMAPSNQMKPEMINYQQPPIGQPQIQNLQNLVTSPNFNSNLNNFGPYTPPVTYNSSMYPHFNNFHQMNIENPFQGQGKEPDALNFGANLDMHRNVNYTEFSDGSLKPLEEPSSTKSSESSTYSLFSGTPDAGTWPPRLQQSLWSGPGPSPLERLLEQQKQMKPSH